MEIFLRLQYPAVCSLIWSFCFYGVNYIFKKFIDQCSDVKKIIKKQGEVNPFRFFIKLHHRNIP